MVWEERGRRYFNTLWGKEAADFHRERNFKYQPDLCMFFNTQNSFLHNSQLGTDLLNLKHIYEWHFSEDAILGAVETQMANIAALICANCPVQAVWHTRGLVNHGGTMENAKLSQAIGLAIAALYQCKTGKITPVEEIDFTTKGHE